MSEYLPYVVVGLASGSVYALAAFGLVVTYKTSGVFNFAHGAIGMIATYLFYTLRHDWELPTPVAIGIAAFVFAPLLGVVIDRVLLPRLHGAVTSTYVVVSLGLLVSLQAVAVSIYGGASRGVEPFLPQSTFRLPGVNVGWDQLILVVLAVAVGAALWAFFRFTHLGLQTRAVVADADLTELVGTDARRVTTFSWMLGSVLAAASGILLAPVIGLDAAILTLLVVQAFGAAAVGRLTSLPLTYVGAMVIGVGAALATKFVAGHPDLYGLPSSLPFLVLFGVLLVSPKRHFRELVEARGAGRAGGARLEGRGLAGPAVLLGAALLVPWIVSGSRLLTATVTLAFVLLFRSLGLLVGLSRQVSLSHAVFVGLGATTLSHLANTGLPFVIALPLAALIVVPVGALIAVPAIRLSGLFLALSTFGFGLLVQALVFPSALAFSDRLSVDVGRPQLFGLGFDGDTAYYFFVLVVVIAGIVPMELLARRRVGRILAALADSQTGIESLGLNPMVPRVAIFCVSAFVAAISGGLILSAYGSVTPPNFDFFQSLVWLTLLVAAGPLSLSGSVLAAVLLIAVPTYLNSPGWNELSPAGFGLMAILMAQQPNGVIGAVSALVARLRGAAPAGERLPTLAGHRAGRTARSPVAERVRDARARRLAET